MSGPRSSRIEKCRLSLACPGVRSKAIGRPPKSVLRWILVEKPPRERPRAWPFCPLLSRLPTHVHGPWSSRASARGGGGARRGERLEHGVEHPRPTEPPEALPDGVSIPELGRQSPPSDVVNGEIMKRFQKLAVVPALVAPARQHRPEHHQDHIPIFLAHPRQHRPLPLIGRALASTWLTSS